MARERLIPGTAARQPSIFSVSAPAAAARTNRERHIDGHLFLVGLTLIAIVAFALSLRIVADSERLAVFVLGRFAGLKGPGLVFLVPGGTQRAIRVRVGDRGELVAPDTVRIDDQDLPAQGATGETVGARVQVVGFSAAAVTVQVDSRGELVCPKCGHSFRASG